MLREQQRRTTNPDGSPRPHLSRLSRINELVLAPHAIVAALPASIEAFFILPDAGAAGAAAKEAARVREARAGFAAEFGTAPPLLLYDEGAALRGSATPFRLTV